MSLFRNAVYARSTFLTKLPQASIPVRRSAVASTKKFKKLKEMQATMQCDDGVPVYLKRGTPDKILYGLTVFLMVVGLIDSARFLSRWAKK